MPRFTLGSLITGLAIALGIVLFLERSALTAGRPVAPTPGAPAGSPVPLAVDYSTGAPVLGTPRAVDFGLHDEFDWTGGLDESTW